MQSYATYYDILRRTAESTPNLELLRCQRLLLGQLHRHIVSRRFFLSSEDEFCYLMILRTGIRLLETPSTTSLWDLESITIVRECNRGLLDCIGISIRGFYESLDVDKTPRLPEQDETADEKIWGPIIDAYMAIKRERVTEQDIVIAAPMLTLAVDLEWSPRIQVAYRVLEDLLTEHYFPEIRTTRIRYFQPQTRTSFDITAHLSSAVISMLCRQLEAGLDWSQVGWWGLLWLAGSIRDDAALARQLDHAAVLQLVILADRALEKDRDNWVEEVCDRRRCLAALFFQTWSARALVGTQDDLDMQSPEWTSREVLQLISSYTRSLADVKLEELSIASLKDFHDRARRAIIINHQHTFHYIEHAILDNPSDAIACELDGAGAWLIERVVSSRDSPTKIAAPDFEEETRNAAKRADAAIRKLALIRQPRESPDTQERAPCATCRIRAGEVANAELPILTPVPLLTVLD